MHQSSPAVLLLGAALLAWPGGDARAASADEPSSVGERFYSVNRPPGIVVDGWEVRPSASLGAGYDDNITLTSDDEPSSSEIVLRAAVDANRGNGPYLFNLNGAVGQTWYPESGENDATEVDVHAGVVFDAKPLSLNSSISFLQGVERAIDNGIFVDGVFEPYTTRAEFRRIPFEAGIAYDISRVKLESDLRIVGMDYETQTTSSGLSVPQDFRTGYEGELRLRGSYEVYPHLSAFAETATTIGRYRDSQGDRDSWRIAAGGSFEFSRLLLGEASAGYTQLSLRTGGETAGLTYLARLHWFVSELVSLTLNAERRFDGEVVTSSSGITSAVPTTHDLISIRTEWEPQRRLFIHAQAGYEEQTHEQVGQRDEFTSISGGASYVLTSSLRLEVDAAYEFGTSGGSRDIERHHVAVGLTAAF